MAAPVAYGRIIGGLVLVSLAIMASAGAVVWQARQHAIDQAFIRTEGLAYALKQHAARTFDATALAVSVVVKQVEAGRPADPAAIHRLIAEISNDAPQIRNILVSDETGAVIHDGLALPPRPFNLADRPHFSAHRDDPSTGVLVSPPFRNPITGLWTLTVSRRIDKADGSFGGVVAAALNLDHLQSFYAQVLPGMKGSIILAHVTGPLILREPAVEPGRSILRSDLYRTYLQKNDHGSFASDQTMDGVPRLVSYRKLIEYPLLVTVSMDTDEALAEWRLEARRAAGAAIVLILVIGGLGWLVVHGMRQRQETLQRLSREKAVVDTILTTLPDGVQLLDADLKPVGWNDSLFEVMDLDKDRIVGAPDPGKALQEALASRDEDGPDGIDAQAANRDATMRADVPVHYRRRLATGKWMECRGTPIPGQGYLAVYRDVTAEVASLAELRDANAALAQQTAQLIETADALTEARHQAEDASRSKSAFLANMSHELRTPLNAVLGFSEIIASQHFGRDAVDRYSAYAADIHRSGRHLLGLINSVLDLSKVEAGRMDLHEEVVDLGTCLKDALMMVEADAKRKSIRIIDQGPLQPMRLRADEQMLRQSLINILSNAVKFTPEGGVVTVGAQRLVQEVAVVITDTGIGIAPADRAKVFEPFGRADGMVSRGIEGTGLGMSLTRHLIELHGGRVELESELGRGTTVTIYLPITRFDFGTFRIVAPLQGQVS